MRRHHNPRRITRFRIRLHKTTESTLFYATVSEVMWPLQETRSEMKRDVWHERYREKHGLLNYYREIVVRRKLVKTLKRIKGAKLEVGCGRAIISDYIGKNDIVIASDLSKDNVKFAKQMHTRIYDFVVCDAKALPFREKSFVVVFSQGLYEHFNDEDLEILLKESRRVCDITVIDIPLEGWKLYLPFQGGSWGERLLRKEFWLKKLENFGEVIYEAYNNFFIPRKKCECIFRIQHGDNEEKVTPVEKQAN